MDRLSRRAQQHYQSRNVEEIITKFAQLPPQERAKRKLESLEALKKTFKKVDHDVNIQDFLGSSNQSAEELSNNVRLLHAQLTDVNKRLSCWNNPEKIDNIESLEHMEESLRESLNRIRLQKDNFARHQLMSLECTNQFQNGLHLPLLIGGVRETQPLAWLTRNENQHLVLPGEPPLLPRRDLECSTDYSMPMQPGYFCPGKSEIQNTKLLFNVGQEGGGTSQELDSATCLRLQLCEQYPFPPYGGLEAKHSEPDTEIKLQGNSMDFQIHSAFQLPRPITMHPTWVPTLEPCAVPVFNFNTLSQQ